MSDILVFEQALLKEGVYIKTGPYVSCIKSPITSLAESLLSLYHESQISLKEEFVDFHVSIEYPGVFRHYFRPQILFKFDGFSPFKPLPAAQVYPFFEWGLNWCIATNSNSHLILHAAVVEKDDCAIIFPAAPGSGKSTLCAGLVARGWRLLSDEMAMIDLKSQVLTAIVRPISLKNESIDVIKKFAPNFYFGSIVHDTNKGTVSHVKVPSVQKDMNKLANPAWMVFPKYEKNAKTSLKQTSKAQAFLRAAENSFNYNVLAETGFNALGDVIDVCECYDFCYSDLDEAIKTFDELAAEKKN